ncbi:hypothetical protein ACTXT7_015599 [Hymenolepis weldensis]
MSFKIPLNKEAVYKNFMKQTLKNEPPDAFLRTNLIKSSSTLQLHTFQSNASKAQPRPPDGSQSTSLVKWPNVREGPHYTAQYHYN